MREKQQQLSSNLLTKTNTLYLVGTDKRLHGKVVFHQFFHIRLSSN